MNKIFFPYICLLKPWYVLQSGKYSILVHILAVLTLRSLVDVYQYFGGTHSHLQSLIYQITWCHNT